MDGAENTRGGGAVFEQAIKKELGCCIRMCAIRKRDFGGKRVAIEPVKQLSAVACNHINLWVMHMRVDKSRHQNLAALIVDHHIGTEQGQQRLCCLHPLNAAIAYQRNGIINELNGGRVASETGVAQTMQQRRANRGESHASMLCLIDRS